MCNLAFTKSRHASRQSVSFLLVFAECPHALQLPLSCRRKQDPGGSKCMATGRACRRKCRRSRQLLLIRPHAKTTECLGGASLRCQSSARNDALSACIGGAG